ncbi:hypothetical protein GCM10010423_28950 [Streptomyces levis]|uniref:Uncharacterized protein n=1 Tax=Streptomyces levis TaxID=285566 RepID=A0ABN3NSI2_9ACTN
MCGRGRGSQRRRRSHGDHGPGERQAQWAYSRIDRTAAGTGGEAGASCTGPDIEAVCLVAGVSRGRAKAWAGGAIRTVRVARGRFLPAIDDRRPIDPGRPPI